MRILQYLQCLLLAFLNLIILSTCIINLRWDVPLPESNFFNLSIRNKEVLYYWKFFETPEVGIIGIFVLLKYENNVTVQ